MTEIRFFDAPEKTPWPEVDALLAAAGLRREQPCDETAVAYEHGRAVATGSRCGDVLQYIAVEAQAEGEGLCESIVSALMEHALARGIHPLFIFTTPSSASRFLSLGFTALVETAQMALMESSASALPAWLASLPRGRGGRTGAIVANADPFTRGHLHLLEQASAACDTVHLFILSAEASAFSATERLEMATRAAQRFSNVLVHPGGRYIISPATFPSYFLKDSAHIASAQMELDAALFARRIAPALGITLRFVGTEPMCPVTAEYNRILSQVLPRHGVELRELERLQDISASRVREHMRAGDWEALRPLVPEENYEYIRRCALARRQNDDKKEQ